MLQTRPPGTKSNQLTWPKVLWRGRKSREHKISPKFFNDTEYDRARFHRTTEVIPRRPWKSKSPLCSRPIRTSISKGTQGVRARDDAILLPFISILRSPCCPVIPVHDFRPKFFDGRQRGMSVPKCLAFFPGFGGPDRSFWPNIRRGIRPKLPL